MEPEDLPNLLIAVSLVDTEPYPHVRGLAQNRLHREAEIGRNLLRHHVRRVRLQVKLLRLRPLMAIGEPDAHQMGFAPDRSGGTPKAKADILGGKATSVRCEV